MNTFKGNSKSNQNSLTFSATVSKTPVLKNGKVCNAVLGTLDKIFLYQCNAHLRKIIKMMIII